MYPRINLVLCKLIQCSCWDKERVSLWIYLPSKKYGTKNILTPVFISWCSTSLLKSIYQAPYIVHHCKRCILVLNYIMKWIMIMRKHMAECKMFSLTLYFVKLLKSISFELWWLKRQMERWTYVIWTGC